MNEKLQIEVTAMKEKSYDSIKTREKNVFAQEFHYKLSKLVIDQRQAPGESSLWFVWRQDLRIQ